MYPNWSTDRLQKVLKHPKVRCSNGEPQFFPYEYYLPIHADNTVYSEQNGNYHLGRIHWLSPPIFLLHTSHNHHCRARPPRWNHQLKNAIHNRFLLL